MKLEKVIETLSRFQRWRKDLEDMPAPNPKHITATIDEAIVYLEEYKAIKDKEART